MTATLARVRSDLVEAAFVRLGDGTSNFALRHLGELLEAAADVDHLNRAILQMAVSGRLVAQDPGEGSATLLIDELRHWRSGVARHKGQRTSSPLEPVTAINAPFMLPATWVWVRLGDIADLQIGRTPNRAQNLYWNDPQMPFISIADLRDGGVVERTKESVSQRALEEIYRGRVVPTGTLLYSFKLTLGKMSITAVDAVHNEAIASIITKDERLRDYLFKALRALDPTGRSNNAVKGKTLNSKSIALLEVPLPPAEEQARIVSALDDLLSLTSSLTRQYSIL